MAIKTRMIWLVGALTLSVTALLGATPASALSNPSSAPLVAAVNQEATVADSVAAGAPLVISGWKDYLGGFKSYGSCMAYGAMMWTHYAGTHQGAWHEYRCVKRQISGCAPNTWALQVKQWLPKGMARTAPTSAALAAPAACAA